MDKEKLKLGLKYRYSKILLIKTSDSNKKTLCSFFSIYNIKIEESMILNKAQR
jgi:hypothetical protein